MTATLSDAMLQALIHFAATGSPDSAGAEMAGLVGSHRSSICPSGTEITATRLQTHAWTGWPRTRLPRP